MNHTPLRRLLLTLLVSCAAQGSGLFASDADLPPVWSYRTQNPVTGDNAQFRFLGGIGEDVRQTAPRQEQNLFALRPVYSQFDYPSQNVKGFDILWPAGIWRDSWFGSFRWFLMLYYGTTGDDFRKDYLYPFWFSGTDQQGFYWGVFPFYGDVRNFLTYQRMRFFLFPVYWQAWKGNTYGESYLWPIVNWDRDPKFEKFRVFPFYAKNKVYDKQENLSILWPLWNQVRSLNPDLDGFGWFVLPLLGHTRWGESNSWTALWPLFYYEKSPKTYALNLPWPVFRMKQEERNHHDLFYIWPFYGKNTTDSYDSRFYLWPIGIHQKDWDQKSMTEGLWILPFYWSRGEYRKDESTGAIAQRLSMYRRVYPFVSILEQGNDLSVYGLDLIPFRNFPALDRNLSPLWRLFSYTRNESGKDLDLLFGMVRNTQTKDREEYFAVSPFYESKSNQMNRILRETEEKNGGKPLISAFQPIEYDAEKSFLFGILKVRTSEVYPTRWKLFWSLEF